MTERKREIIAMEEWMCGFMETKKKIIREAITLIFFSDGSTHKEKKKLNEMLGRYDNFFY